MKIKTKKQLNLPQLIEWLLNSKYSSYIAFSNMGNYVQLEEYGALSFSDEKFYPEETFTVEVEEEITEDTKFSHIVFIDDCDLSASYENKSINEIKYGHDKEFHAYINGEFKLIWRDGKMVE